MAFDQSTRNFLQRTVSKCREILAGRWHAPTEGEFFRQLQEIYGISPDGVAAPMDVLAHLGDEDLETARVLRDTIEHYASGLVAAGKNEKEARREAVKRVAGEQAFTVLNRLAALRMAEERGIVLECVRKGTQSEGFQLFLQSAGSAYGSTSSAYRAYLHVLFDELARDLGVLFNRFDKSSLLFPRHEALESLLKELNGTGEANRDASYSPEQVAALWGEDETIGWIYQYYNDPSERKKMREESSAPRNSRELAVRNQFFTPRYVVEFLTDNTLGRIWYEMTLGATKLKDQCRYLVRRPNEIFLKPGEEPPEQPKQDNLSQEELLKQPVHIPHRPLKDPRTILMLDPACGSMHFGLYAFDLFEVIYDEAWALEEKLGAGAFSRPPGMKALHDAYEGKDAFLQDVPRLIIEHNLHGIDIDPRCAQIAGLSLWLRAQKVWQRLSLPPANRPSVTRSNIVCAEPMPGEKELLREFVDRSFPPVERGVFLQLLEAIFDKMQLAGEAGSLLKIEEEIRSAVAEAKKVWKAGPKLEQAPLFGDGKPQQKQIALDYSGITEVEFWEQVEERIYNALRDYAEQADTGGGVQRRLFAEDAARGFAFIDVCRKRYDVALMNPPFGEATASLKFLIQLKFELSKYDLGATFLDCVSSMLTPTGCVGLLSNRTIYFLSRLSAFRKHALNTFGISCFADLGSGVLDAMVEAAAACFAKSASTGQAVFSRNTQDDDKGAALLENLREANSTNVFITRTTALAESDTCEFCYWIPHAIQVLRGTPQTLGHAGVEVRQGIATGDNFRFLRLLWEIPAGELFQLWHPYAKGGDYSPLFYSIHLCVVWGSKWRDFFNGNTTVFSCLVTRNSEKYLNRPGLTYPTRTSSRFAPRMMPAGTIFDTKGSAIFHPTIKTIGDDSKPLIALAALLNTALAQCIVDTYVGAAEDSSRSYGEGVIERLPFTPALFDTAATHEKFGRLITKLFAIARRDERAPYFVASFSDIGTLREQFDQCVRSCKETSAEYDRFFQECDSMLSEKLNLDKPSRGFIANEVARYPSLTPDCLTCPDHRSFIEQIVAELLGFAFGRWDIRYATGEQAAPELPDPFAPLPVCPPGQLQNAQGLPARPEDVPSAYPVRIPWDGILVDDPNHPLDIESRVREVIEIIWKDRAEAIEHEACEILGVKLLRDYFRKPAGFFADHLKRYSKSRRQAPIYWPLSTASGSYTLWIYYHRLTPDTLYKCVQQFVNPKLADVEKELNHFRTVLGANEGGAKERKRLEDLEDLRSELIELRAELELWGPKWKPNLNDGVLITAAPLWKLFRLPKWQKALKDCWQELERGDYDWAHLAYTLFPDRVREKCRSDRSLAIAHKLEDLCQVQAPAPKKTRGKKTKKPAAEDALL
jgi:hypothetical protein